MFIFFVIETGRESERPQHPHLLWCGGGQAPTRIAHVTAVHHPRELFCQHCFFFFFKSFEPTMLVASLMPLLTYDFREFLKIVYLLEPEHHFGTHSAEDWAHDFVPWHPVLCLLHPGDQQRVCCALYLVLGLKFSTSCMKATFPSPVSECLYPRLLIPSRNSVRCFCFFFPPIFVLFYQTTDHLYLMMVPGTDPKTLEPQAWESFCMTIISLSSPMQVFLDPF